jgi:hypothetical protein
MIRFDRRQLLAFLRAIDRNLPRPASVVVIGGAAAAVAYRAGVMTADIDLMHGFTNEIAKAAAVARQQTGLAIAVGPAPVADLPYGYEDRLRHGRGLALRRLTLAFPDKYDLALSKVVRGYEHDLDAIEGIHRRHRLSARTLVARFETEMGAAIIDPQKLRLNVAMLCARLYGLQLGRQLADRWGVPAPRAGRRS